MMKKLKLNYTMRWKNEYKKINKSVKQLNKALIEMNEFLDSVNDLPLFGDGAKEQAIREWKEDINNVIIQLNNLKNVQIELILERHW